MGRIFVVGIGPGSPDYLTPKAVRAIADAGAVAASDRQLKTIEGVPGLKDKPRVKVGAGRPLSESLAEIEGLVRGGADVAVCVSGDPGFHSFLGPIRRRFPDLEIASIPGVSSIQCLASALGVCWQDAAVLSLHGCDGSKEIREALKGGRDVFALTDRSHGVAYCAKLALECPRRYRIFIGENLSYPDEFIGELSIGEALSWDSGDRLCVVCLKEADGCEEI